MAKEAVRRRATWRVWVLWLSLVLPGMTVVVVCGIYLCIDYPLLQFAESQFLEVARTHDVAGITFAAAREQALRTNVFAEGVWLLLGAALAGLGVHGLCLLPREPTD